MVDFHSSLIDAWTLLRYHMLVVIGITCLHHKHMTYGQLSCVTKSFVNLHVDSELISKINGVFRIKGKFDHPNIFFPLLFTTSLFTTFSVTWLIMSLTYRIIVPIFVYTNGQTSRFTINVTTCHLSIACLITSSSLPPLTLIILWKLWSSIWAH